MKNTFSMLRLAAFAFAAVAGGSTSLAAGATERSLAPILASGDWVGAPADAASLRGRVVLVDVFTFGCSNCRNIVANLRQIHASYARDVAVVGVHAPETDYERDRARVVASLAEQGIAWPVRLDNAFAVWHAYGIEAWPTQLLFDRHGRLRETIVGDSQDAHVDAALAALRAEH